MQSPSVPELAIRWFRPPPFNPVSSAAGGIDDAIGPILTALGRRLPAWLRPFIAALQQITAGSRDRTLADNPDLVYTMAAEILFLIETLEQEGERGT